ncbi:sulfotransferase [Allomuricauda ruestringensis DSM 13258]|uniref:Sulfotransferase n=1 Tax=Allomuricauda ruestringensis (strain DSM 13258 / CIP 107369 / LMG 19739 / B1) TaxID=886377 RepID=G2PPM7_ALLRU|nr:sulfotransferase [Allomuricauda ruestringensis]AEM70408.1 sulfotransferase [Allomuricauda ruestringensis DSM 13258]
MKNNIKPNFLIVGFPKCGSTALHYYLNSHPEIYMPNQKELHFFTSDILGALKEGKGDKYVKGTQIKDINNYLSHYEGVQNEKAIGDASPSYVNYPEKAIPRIKNTLGNPKIIILLRDPIKRAYSNYLHLVRENRESLGFFDALQQENKRKEQNFSDFWYYQFNSTYFDKVKSYQNHFDEVLVLTQEELNNNVLNTVQKVFAFLGVDPNFEPGNIEKRYNPGGVYKKNIITNLIFNQSGLRELIKKLVPITPRMKHLKHWLIKKYKTQTPKMPIESEEYLVESLKEDVRKLTEIGVDTSTWNPRFFN